MVMLISKVFLYQKIIESKSWMSFYTNKYQNHVGYSFRYKLLRVDDQFSKSFESYLA